MDSTFLDLFSSNVTRQPLNSLPNDIKRYDNIASYNDVFRTCIFENIPCVISNVTEKWRSALNWKYGDSINIKYLTEVYGNQTVPVVNCDNAKFNSHERTTMLFSEFIDRFNSHDDGEDTNVLYLKDWHLRRQNTNDKFYSVPRYFASDWLNEYCIDTGEDDFMFVYIGPKHSWTPFHADVYSSFSWSANVIGQKEWYIFPPTEEMKLKKSNGDIPMDIRPLLGSNINYIHFIQSTGDAIFIPSGWHHQVHNLEDTISINHNWINGCNIMQVWEALEYNFSLVKKEIEEFQETNNWSEQCELILKSLFGMDHKGFFEFMHHISTKRMQQLRSDKCVEFDNWTLGGNHLNFDINCLNYTIKNILNKYELEETIYDNYRKIHNILTR